MKNNIHDLSESEFIDVSKKEKTVMGSFVSEVIDFFKWAIIAGAITWVISGYLLLFTIVPTGSMENTIPTGSAVIYNRHAYSEEKKPEQGDVIAFYRSNDDRMVYTKRIVAVEGDMLEIKNGITYINNEVYDETGWLKETPEPLNYGPVVVPEGKVFCMGDNRNNSHDCRFWAETFVDISEIQGKAVCGLSSGAKVLKFPDIV